MSPPPTRLGLVALLAIACEGRGGPAPTPSVAPSATAPLPAPGLSPQGVVTIEKQRPAPFFGHDGGVIADAPFSTGRLPLKTSKTCRALTVKGTVTELGGKPVESGAPLEPTLYLDVAAGGALVVKHSATGREVTVLGPATVLPCARGEERFVLPRGHLTTATWAGARPGAEVLIATPFALVRYGDAALDVSVEATRLGVKATQGDAWIELGGDGSSDRKVAAGTQEARAGAPEAPAAAVARCEQAAVTAEARARDVLTTPGGAQGAPPLGERAAVHVRARRTATAACAIAEAVVARGGSGPERDGFARALERAEARYRSVPSIVAPPR